MSSFYIFRKGTRDVKRISVIIYHFGSAEMFLNLQYKDNNIIVSADTRKKVTKKILRDLVSTLNSQLSTLKT